MFTVGDQPSLDEENDFNRCSVNGEGVLDSPGGSSSLASGDVNPSPLCEGLFVSAPGKLILFGEHAVVYGNTAIAGSIDLRTYVSVLPSTDGRIHLSLPDLGVDKTWLLKDLLKAADCLAADDPVEEDQAPSLEVLVPIARRLSGSCEDQSSVQDLAILAFWYLLLGVAQRKRNLLAIKATVRSELPSFVGLGSSGAYCVSVAASLLQNAGLISAPSSKVDHDGCRTWSAKDLDMIRKWATAAEALIHGRTSGLDTAISTVGGIVSYGSKTGIEHLKNVPNLSVVLVNSKVERNTAKFVENVKEKLRTQPDIVESIFNEIDEISKEGARILQKPADDSGDMGEDSPSSRNRTTSRLGNNDHHSLQDLCRRNNELLNALGVGHPKIDEICASLSRCGIHAKMTGAGGGGSVFGFLPPDMSRTDWYNIKTELNKPGYEVFQPKLGRAGVVEHISCPDIFLKHFFS